MSAGVKVTGLLVAGILCLLAAGKADAKADTKADTQATHRVHKAKKPPLPPPLPSGTRGPVPSMPLDSTPAVAPQVTYQDGLLTIVAPNSTLGDILRSVRKHTAAEIEIPSTANERVVTHLGPAPARDVVAELLNGSHFNYILLGSPEDAKLLVRVVLVAKPGPDNPPPTPPDGSAAQATPAANPAADAADAEAPDDTPDESADQGTAETEPAPAVAPDQPGVKTPQQMLQEMQQRQLQMQQQQQQQTGPQPTYPPPGMVPPQRPQPPQEPQ